MIEIIPAIIALDFEELEKKVRLVEPYVGWAQIDVMDGEFTPLKSFNNPKKLKDLKTLLNLEAHLMINHPEKVIEEWIDSGVKRILVHFESTNKFEELIKKIKDSGLKVGVALKLETPVMVINDLIKKIDVVQLMGIAEIGYYGRLFDDRVLEKIKILRAKHPNVKIEIDGGINLENAKKVIKAGVNHIVVGSYIFSQSSETINKNVVELNIKKAIDKLKNIN